MTASVLRGTLLAVCAGGVAGMIVTSVADATSGALAFGLLTAGAAFALICVTAVTSGGRAQPEEALAGAVEDGVAQLVDAGADEHSVRRLVGAAVRLGEARNR
jgi:hypothetical protein